MASPIVTVARLGAAGAWLYQGLYAKILQGDPAQRESIAALVGEEDADAATVALGAVETVLGAWVLTGAAPRACATLQTLALAGLTAAQLGAATSRAGDPEQLVLRAAGRTALAWIAAR